MNTASAPAVVEIAVGQDNLSSPAQRTDHLETRWGFQMAQRDMILNAFECGVALVPFAQFFAIRSFNAPRENHTIDWTQPKERMALIPAAEAEEYLMQALGGHGAQNKTNWGLQTAFHNVSDAGKMAVLNSILMPPLSRIREIGRELQTKTIADECKGSDELDFGVRESCVTCYWEWLNSPGITLHISRALMQTYTVTERDRSTGAVAERPVQLSLAELETAKKIMLAAGQQGIKQLQAVWTLIATEYEKTEGRTIVDFEHGIRKDLHQSQPQDRQMELARTIAASTNRGGGDSVVVGQALQQLAQSQAEANRQREEDMALRREELALRREELAMMNRVQSAVIEPHTGVTTVATEEESKKITTATNKTSKEK